MRQRGATTKRPQAPRGRIGLLRNVDKPHAHAWGYYETSTSPTLTHGADRSQVGSHVQRHRRALTLHDIVDRFANRFRVPEQPNVATSRPTTAYAVPIQRTARVGFEIAERGTCSRDPVDHHVSMCASHLYGQQCPTSEGAGFLYRREHRACLSEIQLSLRVRHCQAPVLDQLGGCC